MGGVRIAWAAIGVSAALGLGGCSGSSASASAGAAAPDDNAAPAQTAAVSAPDACSLLPEAILAKKYLGAAASRIPAGAPESADIARCQWADDHGAITLQTGPWDAVYTKSGEDRLAGFGDESYDTPSGLYVREGDVGVGISVVVGNGASWGAAADNAESQAVAAEHQVAPDIMAKF